MGNKKDPRVWRLTNVRFAELNFDKLAKGVCYELNEFVLLPGEALLNDTGEETTLVYPNKTRHVLSIGMSIVNRTSEEIWYRATDPQEEAPKPPKKTEASK